MRAEIVSVGTELLLGQIVDTNAAYIAAILPEYGVSIYRRTTVGDNHDRLLTALKAALAENDLVITIGGLGPTQDDITRETLAEAIGDTLHQDDGIAERLESFFRSRGVPMPRTNLKQALVPANGRALDNPNGTAPGLLFELHGKAAIALPGPPGEFIPMVDNQVAPWLRNRTGSSHVMRSRVLRICGMGESSVEQAVKDLIGSSNPTVAPYAKTGEVHLRVTASAADVATADAMVEERVNLIAARLGDHIYGTDLQTLESAVVEMLASAGKTVSTAESCTGGLLAARITDVPGCSAVYPGSVVSYSNTAKSHVLQVSAELIDQFGAVSQQVAEAMAQQCRLLFATDFGVGITGVAGPDGGTPDKPVGTVFIAIATDQGVKTEPCRFTGIRKDVRYRSTQTALTMLRSILMVKAA